MIEGWYYLHGNGSLIYKGAAYTSVEDFRESDLVRAFWPVEPDDREKAWSLLVEASAAGADLPQVVELAEKWGCDDADAQEYARRVNVGLVEVEGGGWGAYPGDVLVIGESIPASVGADGRRHGSSRGSWSVSARQTVTGRELAVYGYSSLASALEDCLAMVRDYERDDLLELAPPGLS